MRAFGANDGKAPPTPAAWIISPPSLLGSTARLAETTGKLPFLGSKRRPVGGESQCEWMPWLIEPHLASARQLDLGDRTPSGFLHLRTPHAFVPECQYLCPQVVTHEIEFVPITFLGGVECHFCGRQSENRLMRSRVKWTYLILRRHSCRGYFPNYWK